MISGAGREYTVKVPMTNEMTEVAGFVENDGVVAIEAVHFEKSTATSDASWTTVPNLGRTGSVVTPSGVNSLARKAEEDSPSLEYTSPLLEYGNVNIATYVSPTLNFKQGEGLRFAIAIDDESPHVVNIDENEKDLDCKYAT